jgi:hypothetical protein
MASPKGVECAKAVERSARRLTGHSSQRASSACLVKRKAPSFSSAFSSPRATYSRTTPSRQAEDYGSLVNCDELVREGWYCVREPVVLAEARDSCPRGNSRGSPAGVNPCESLWQGSWLPGRLAAGRLVHDLCQGVQLPKRDVNSYQTHGAPPARGDWHAARDARLER